MIFIVNISLKYYCADRIMEDYVRVINKTSNGELQGRGEAELRVETRECKLKGMENYGVTRIAGC